MFVGKVLPLPATPSGSQEVVTYLPTQKLVNIINYDYQYLENVFISTYFPKSVGSEETAGRSVY